MTTTPAPRVRLLKHIGTHALLASAYVAYDWGSSAAWPIHALLVFTIASAFVLLFFAGREIWSIVSGPAIWIAALSGGFYAGYFLCLLFGIMGTDAASAALVLSLSVCSNGAVAILSKNKRMDFSLLVFTACIFLVILLLKTKGAPGAATVNRYFFLLLGALVFEFFNALIRRFYCQRKNLDAASVAKGGLFLSVLVTIVIVIVDALFISGIKQTIAYVKSYTLLTYLSWLYLGTIPNIVMLTWSIQCENANALLFHSLSGLKYVIAAIMMLFIPALLQKSLFYKVSSLTITLTILLLALIYLYNVQDQILGLLRKQSPAQEEGGG